MQQMLQTLLTTALYFVAAQLEDSDFPIAIGNSIDFCRVFVQYTSRYEMQCFGQMCQVICKRPYYARNETSLIDYRFVKNDISVPCENVFIEKLCVRGCPQTRIYETLCNESMPLETCSVLHEGKSILYQCSDDDKGTWKIYVNINNYGLKKCKRKNPNDMQNMKKIQCVRKEITECLYKCTNVPMSLILVCRNDQFNVLLRPCQIYPEEAKCHPKLNSNNTGLSYFQLLPDGRYQTQCAYGFKRLKSTNDLKICTDNAQNKSCIPVCLELPTMKHAHKASSLCLEHSEQDEQSCSLYCKFGYTAHVMELWERRSHVNASCKSHMWTYSTYCKLDIMIYAIPVLIILMCLAVLFGFIFIKRKKPNEKKISHLSIISGMHVYID